MVASGFAGTQDASAQSVGAQDVGTEDFDDFDAEFDEPAAVSPEPEPPAPELPVAEPPMPEPPAAELPPPGPVVDDVPADSSDFDVEDSDADFAGDGEALEYGEPAGYTEPPSPEPTELTGSGEEPHAPVAEAPAEKPTSNAEPSVGKTAGTVTLPVPGSVEPANAVHNTMLGSTGGVRVVDARPAELGTFRLQLATEFFGKNGFINDNDGHSHIGAFLSASAAIHERVEIFGSLSSIANANRSEEPELFQVLGDLTLGAKSAYEVLPWLHVGGFAELGLLNTVGDIGVVFSSTSLKLGGTATADFRKFDPQLPLIGRFNLGYFFDNSSKLISGTEKARYNALDPDDRESFALEERHLVTAVERYALNINRSDMLSIGLGAEGVLEPVPGTFVHPLFEWNWGIPVNRQGYDCLFIPSSEGSSTPAGVDGCLGVQGSRAYPMWMTVGARVRPPVEGLSAFFAVDIGLTGTKTFVRELAPNAPYMVMLGVSYAYDTRPRVEIREVALESVVEDSVDEAATEGDSVEETAALAVLEARIRGRVVSTEDERPIEGAVVQFVGRDLSALYTDGDGGFTSYRFEPGQVSMAITHVGYLDGSCDVVLGTPAEGAEFEDLEVICPLEPVAKSGMVQGMARDDRNRPVAVSMVLEGASDFSQTVRSDDTGAIQIEGLDAGDYRLRVTDEAFFAQVHLFTLEPRGSHRLELVLHRRPRQRLVSLRENSLRLRKRIRFAPGTADISERSLPLVEEIADVLLRESRIKLIEIRGHTDNRGPQDVNQKLSEERADAVRQQLMRLGVPSQRLQVRGFGASRPIVPNITSANRARNRRVDVAILESEPEE